MPEHALVPFDGSPLSVDALRHALVEFPDASITVLHVVDLFDPGYGAHLDVETPYAPVMGSEAWYGRVETVSDRLGAEARTLAADHGREVAVASEIGDPERVVVDHAAEEDIDHVVLGAHGRAGTSPPVFGRVAETVVRRAPVPVTVVR